MIVLIPDHYLSIYLGNIKGPVSFIKIIDNFRSLGFKRIHFNDSYYQMSLLYQVLWII